MAEEKIIGIDLGTTNSVVAVMEGNEAKVIANQEGNRITPSVVAFAKDGNRLVGDPAKRQAITNPTKTIYSIKRFMGRRHSEVESEEKLVPYKVVGAAGDLVKVDIDGKQYTPPEISAMILRKLKEAAEAYLGHTVRKAVITVPAYFNDGQRQATIDAAAVAGFDTEWEIEGKDGKKTKQRMRIINEPTAAALAYAMDKKKDQKIAVFDLGGGTFDISVMSVDNGIFEVLATGGDSALGGEDWDRRILERVVDEVFDQYRVDLTASPMAMSRLKESCEAAKKVLSIDREVTLQLPFLANDPHGAPINYEKLLTREQIDVLTKDLLERLESPCVRALADAGLAAADIEEVLLVGGMTRWPTVQAIVEGIFGRKPSKGANPDEVVALGAAQYAGILAGEADDAALLDVTPHDIGIKIGESQFAVVVPRNSMLPVRTRRQFATSTENQQFVTIELYQGDSSEQAGEKFRRKLGQVTLDDLPPGPAGSVRVELGITVDVEGLLAVTAREVRSGREASVTIRPSGGLSQREIIEIITRRRRETSGVSQLPTPGAGSGGVRVTTREHSVPQLEDDLAASAPKPDKG